MIQRSREAVFRAISDRFYFGWAILALAGFGIFSSGPGQSHTFSVFLGPISQDLQIGKDQIAFAYGVATTGAAFLLPYMGRWVDRHGPSRMMLLVIVGLGLACLFFGAAANFLWLIVGFGLLRFLGQGSLMLNCANIVSQWFLKKRGFAMGLMASGFGVSIAVHPPLGQYLIDTVGWRQAWLVLGLITWLTMLPAIFLIAWDKPEDRGLQPDGDDAPPPDQPKAALVGLTLKEALRTDTFYICVTAFFSISMLVTSLHFSQVDVLVSHGVDRTIAAWAFPVTAAIMLIAMPFVGRLFDRYKTRHIFALGLLVQATSLVLITFAVDAPTTMLYAVCFGINNAFSMTMFGYLWPRYFGRKHIGEIQGTGQMILVIGASLGPLPVGYALEHLATPDLMLRGLAVFPVLCAIAVQFLRTPEGITGYEHLD